MTTPAEATNLVFVSHSSRDFDVAFQIVGALEQAGIRCWIAPRDIIPGSNYNAEITAGIQASTALVVVESRHAVESDQVVREIDAAANRRIPVIPVRIEAVQRSEAMEHLLRTYHWIDAFPAPVARHLETIVVGVQRALQLAHDQPVPDVNAIPKFIGPYRVLDLLGEGGMGGVYRAEQRSPIRRTVALKRIKPGLDTKDVLARFESERQALARMDHPNIAKVLDAGSDNRGRPYFVMEYVPGKPITEYADENKLSIEERLKLFIQVCYAIAHAHTKAIIHRDIKSSNILAYTSEGQPAVRVIDFGIAKALTADRLTDRSFATERGFAIGTYENMSPEQAEGSLDIDTRTDVYSLGVLLYELLAGAKPFESRTLAECADAEIRRIIREVEPSRPSTRVTSSDSGSKVASARSIAVDALAKQLKSELEWIPLMAMRKERDRRYDSALDIAEDVQNYLENRPLKAGPESFAYRAQKAIRRNRVAVLGGVTAACVAIAAIGFYVYSINAEQRRTAQALQRVVTEQQQKEQALADAKAQSELATQRLNEKRSALDEMLLSFSDDNLRVQPGSQPIRKLFLGRGLQQYQALLADKSQDINVVLRTCDAWRELALLEEEMGQVEDCKSHLTAAIALCRQSLSTMSDDPRLRSALGKILLTMAQTLIGREQIPESTPLAQEGREVFEGLLAGDTDNADYKFGLARALMILSFSRSNGDGGQPEDERSVELLRQAVATKPNDAEFISELGRAINNQVILKYGDNRNEDAVDMVKEAVQLQSRSLAMRPTLVTAHTRRVKYVKNLTFSYSRQNTPDKGLVLLDESIVDAKRFVAENPAVLVGLVSLTELQKERGIILSQLGRFDDAVKSYQEVIQGREVLAQREPKNETHLIECINAISKISLLFESRKRTIESVAVLDTYTSRAEDILTLHPKSASILDGLMGLYVTQGNALYDTEQTEQARAVYQRSVDLYAKHYSSLPVGDENATWNFVACCIGLENIAKNQNNVPMAVKLLETYVRPIDVNKIEQAKFKQLLLQKLAKLASYYERLERNKEALELRLAILRTTQETMQQNPDAALLCKRFIYESYEPIALLYRKLGDKQRAFEALKRYFKETEPYFWERDHSRLLSASTKFSETQYEQLWKLFDQVSQDRSKATVSVSDKVGGTMSYFEVSITYSWQFVEDQFKELRGGMPDGFLQQDYNTYLKLYDIAKKNQVPFAIVISSIQTPSDNTEALQLIERIAEQRKLLSTEPRNSLARLELAELLIRQSRSMDTGGKSSRPVFLAEEALTEVDRCLADGINEPTRISMVQAAVWLIKGRVEMRQGRNQVAYLNFQNAVQQLGSAADETAALRGEIFVELAKASKNQGRLFEATHWYLLAAELGTPGGLYGLTSLAEKQLAIQQVYPPRLQKLLAEAPPAKGEEHFQLLARRWHEYSPKIQQAEDQAKRDRPKPVEGSRFVQEMKKINAEIPILFLMRGRNYKGVQIYCFLKCTGEQYRRLQEAVEGPGTFNISDFGEVIAAGYGDPPDDLREELNAKFYKMFTPGKNEPPKSKRIRGSCFCVTLILMTFLGCLACVLPHSPRKANLMKCFFVPTRCAPSLAITVAFYITLPAATRYVLPSPKQTKRMWTSPRPRSSD